MLKRFVEREEDLFTQGMVDRDQATIDAEFSANFPANMDYLTDLPALRDLKGSDFIVNMLAKTASAIPKRDLYMLGAVMRPEEIHGDVISALEAIAAIVPATVPSVIANVAPPDANGIGEDVSTPD